MPKWISVLRIQLEVAIVIRGTGAGVVVSIVVGDALGLRAELRGHTCFVSRAEIVEQHRYCRAEIVEQG